ncbi:DnaJ-domain-containing protein [Colletotrichum somersetense]|nr:DnaJ-domain-containing protein [Colletotrichum somersetense]
MLLRRLQPAAARPLRSGALPFPVPSPVQLPRARNLAAAAPFTTSRALRDDVASANHYETLKVAHDASPSDIKKCVVVSLSLSLSPFLPLHSNRLAITGDADNAPTLMPPHLELPLHNLSRLSQPSLVLPCPFEKQADASQLPKRSFYALSKTHHPDHNRDDPDASRKFHAIAEAYSVLGTPAKRAAYDRSLPSSSSSSSPHGRRGSYHSTGPAGGRPASGLSRRRTTFRGPPPSFYRSGGWGAQSAKRREAHEGAGGGDDGTGTGASAQPGMGPGQDPYQHTRSGEVPHFDSQTHTRSQSRQDSRRAHRIAGTEVRIGPQETSVGAFLVVSGILFFSFFVPYVAVGGLRRKKNDA